MEITATGACRFCGQIKMISLPKEEWEHRIRDKGLSREDIADDIATEQCGCREGETFRKDRQMIAECGENIEEMFRENHPDIADLFQEAKELIWMKKIKKITVATYEDGTASMYRSGGNMEIRFTKKNETKLTVTADQT